jgi:predicted nucleic acid-binding protein
MLLVDTSVWIDFLNGFESAEAKCLANGITDNQPIMVTGIVLTEILAGLRSESEADRIGSLLLDGFEFAPEPSRADYVAAAKIYRACRAGGATLRSSVDCLIAQVCLRDSLLLLTKDRDFNAIARHVPLNLMRVPN